MRDAPPAVLANSEPIVAEIYAALLDALRQIGPFTAEEKKTSIHLVRRTGFAGVHPRKARLVLNLRLDRPFASPRASKTEQVSRNRWHHEFRIERPEDIDADILALLRDAYEIAG